MKKKYLLFAVLIVLIAGALYYFFSPAKSNLSESQKKQTLQKMLGRELRQEKDVPTGVKTYSGKYLSFDYPARASEYKHNRENILKDKFILDNFQFQQDSGPRYFFNIQVQDATVSAALTDLSGISFRESTPDYKKSAQKIAGTDAIIFQKENADGGEISAFFSSKNKYLTFIITGSQLSELMPVFQRVVSSVVVK